MYNETLYTKEIKHVYNKTLPSYKDNKTMFNKSQHSHNQ